MYYPCFSILFQRVYCCGHGVGSDVLLATSIRCVSHVAVGIHLMASHLVAWHLHRHPPAPQAKTFEEVFKRFELSPVDFVRLMDVAERRVVPKGTCLSQEGRVQEEVFLIVEGAAQVRNGVWNVKCEMWNVEPHLNRTICVVDVRRGSPAGGTIHTVGCAEREAKVSVVSRVCELLLRAVTW